MHDDDSARDDELHAAILADAYWFVAALLLVLMAGLATAATGNPLVGLMVFGTGAALRLSSRKTGRFGY